jgi:hypothetical protein
MRVGVLAVLVYLKEEFGEAIDPDRSETRSATAWVSCS